jgi:hypothetical protein
MVTPGLANDPAWPQFRGFNSAGIAAMDIDPSVKISPDENVICKETLPAGHSSPCIWGNFGESDLQL